MFNVLLQIVFTTVYLAGIVALLAAWFPTAAAALRQDKQTGISWWQNPGLTNMPVYGLAIVGLLLWKLSEMSGKRRLITVAPGLALMGLIYVAIANAALSVV